MPELSEPLPRDPTRVPTRASALALLQHLEDVYTDRDWAHAPDVQRALKATLVWLDAEPRSPSELEAVGMGPVWAATQALVNRLGQAELQAGWPQDPAVLALVKLAGRSKPQSLADLRTRQLPLGHVAQAADPGALARLGRAWAAYLQTLPYQIALVNSDRSFEVLPARLLGHPGGYLAAFMAAVRLQYPDHPLLALELQAITPSSTVPGFPLGACPVLPATTVPVFIWLELMAEVWTHHVQAHPPLTDTQGRSIVDLSPGLKRLQQAVAEDRLPWLKAVSQAQWEKQTGWDWSQPLSHLGQPRL